MAMEFWTRSNITGDEIMDRAVYAPSQWETVLQCNAISHWLGAYTKWKMIPGCRDYRSTDMPLDGPRVLAPREQWQLPPFKLRS